MLAFHLDPDLYIYKENAGHITLPVPILNETINNIEPDGLLLNCYEQILILK
jgi:hypothetical protein